MIRANHWVVTLLFNLLLFLFVVALSVAALGVILMLAERI
jgi:hypothetical protein